jgi:hypothetical protein
MKPHLIMVRYRPDLAFALANLSQRHFALGRNAGPLC